MANRLAGETSAYLRQHRNNPVDWYPWGEEAWARARSEGRPVLVSIGYSSCHWCHVMERECFENDEIARLMNDRLVCIKVDREERPDIDQIYMDAVLCLTGAGGWPLNAFCTPDGRPFFGGTYFPPERVGAHPSWPETIEAVSRFFERHPERVEEQARQILEALSPEPEGEPGARPGLAALAEVCTHIMRQADTTHGGFGAAPKFPTPTYLEALLFAADRGVAPAGALDHVLHTCKRMSRGGIFDHLGGGFHRYSTDARWLVPHFEKMLYDAGQLLRVYAEAYRQSGDEELRWPVEETIGWLEREMRSSEDGFYASQDADSEGEEGRFYVWDRAEIEAVLGAEAAAEFCQSYAVSASGSFERTGKSVLEHALAGPRDRYRAERQKLFEARQQRTPPDTDRKHITSWIAYAVSGMASAGAAFERGDWVEGAARAAEFVRERLHDEQGRLLRIWDGEAARIPAFLDDHAAWLCALLDLHRAGAGDGYLDAAIGVAERIGTAFFDAAQRKLFFSASGRDGLPFRPQSDADGATPAAAGLAALGLVRVCLVTGRDDLREVAEAVLATEGSRAHRFGGAGPTLARATALLETGVGVGLVIGEGADEATQALARRARELLASDDMVAIVSPSSRPTGLHSSWLEGRVARQGRPTAYLCRERVCSPPALRPEELELPGTEH